MPPKIGTRKAQTATMLNKPLLFLKQLTISLG